MFDLDANFNERKRKSSSSSPGVNSILFMVEGLLSRSPGSETIGESNGLMSLSREDCRDSCVGLENVHCGRVTLGGSEDITSGCCIGCRCLCLSLCLYLCGPVLSWLFRVPIGQTRPDQIIADPTNLRILFTFSFSLFAALHNLSPKGFG